MLELALDIFADALKDTLYLVPFLLVTYLLLETLEHKAGAHTERLVQKAGHFGPAVAAVLGAVPQCGFSAAGAALFSSRAITWHVIRCVPFHLRRDAAAVHRRAG